jgi:hypothetical protein
VAQNLLGALRRDASLGHQRAGQVTHVVEAQRRQPCPAQCPTEDVPQQFVGLDRSAHAMRIRLAWEHQTAFGRRAGEPRRLKSVPQPSGCHSVASDSRPQMDREPRRARASHTSIF